MRKAITASQLAPPPERQHRERVAITTKEIDLSRRPRQPGAKGFVDVITTSDLDENRKIKAPVEETKKGKTKKA